MNFAEIFSFHGRARMTHMALIYIVLGVVVAVAGALAAQIDDRLQTAVALPLSLSILPTFVRRMHDSGRPGWWAALPMLAVLLVRAKITIDFNGEWPTPWTLVLAIAYLALHMTALWLLFRPADFDVNAYGPDPRVDPVVEDAAIV